MIEGAELVAVAADTVIVAVPLQLGPWFLHYHEHAQLTTIFPEPLGDSLKGQPELLLRRPHFKLGVYLHLTKFFKNNFLLLDNKLSVCAMLWPRDKKITPPIFLSFLLDKPANLPRTRGSWPASLFSEPWNIFRPRQ
jgi:hypothetical protein